MATRKVKPTSNARRQMTQDSFSDITKNKPEKALMGTLKNKAGRGNRGNITVRHRGGGAKRRYRIIDFKMTKEVSGEVLAIEYDPNRSARIALVKDKDGNKFYMLAPAKVKPGSKIKSGEKVDVNVGNRMKLENIPAGTTVFNIELTPGKGGQLARSAGTGARLAAKEGKYVHIKLPSGEIRLVDKNCMATIGSASNSEHSNIKVGKAGRSRHMRRRPTVRGKVMNPNDHPHGGGEGAQPIGLIHPKTPWGMPALGFKTRNRKKKSSEMIIRDRRKKK